jgi:hypothetical protein
MTKPTENATHPLLTWTAADLRLCIGLQVPDGVTAVEWDTTDSKGCFVLSDGRVFVRNPDFPRWSADRWVDARDDVSMTEATA